MTPTRIRCAERPRCAKPDRTALRPGPRSRCLSPGSLHRLGAPPVNSAGPWAHDPRNRPKSVPCLPLLSEGEDVYGIIGRVIAIQGQVAGLPEWNHQLTQLGQLRDRSPEVGACLQKEPLTLARLRGPLSGLRRLGDKELPAALQALDRALRDNYLWTFGAGCSSSVPHVLNHSRTCAPVTCRPVSWNAAHDAIASSLKVSRLSSRSRCCHRPFSSGSSLFVVGRAIGLGVPGHTGDDTRAIRPCCTDRGCCPGKPMPCVPLHATQATGRAARPPDDPDRGGRSSRATAIAFSGSRGDGVNLPFQPARA